MQNGGAHIAVDSNADMQNGTALAIDTSAQMQNGAAVDPSALTKSGAVDAGSHAHSAGSTAAKHDDSNDAAVPEEYSELLYRMAYRFAAALALRNLSMLYAVLTPLALWLYADRPVAVVWAFSAIVCSYLSPWIIFLTVTMRTRTVLVSIWGVALVAAAIAHLGGPVTGTLIAHLDTFYASGLLGYALAERRQHDGAEQSAAAIATCSKEQLEKHRATTKKSSFFGIVVSFACAALAAWLVWRSTVDVPDLVLLSSLIVAVSLEFWLAILSIHMLHVDLVTPDHILLIFVGSELQFLPVVVVSFVFGKAIGALVYSPGVMCVAGFLGYTLAVYARYNELLAGKMQAEPVKKQQTAAVNGVPLYEIICSCE